METTAAAATPGKIELTPEQRQKLAAAKAWWQEGEQALDFLAERARQEARLAQIQALIHDLRATAQPDGVVGKLAPLLRLIRVLSANRALNRTLLTETFAAALNDLLHGPDALPERLARFLETQPVGAQTASQLLYAAFPDRFPLVSPATSGVFCATRAQRRAARRVAAARYVVPEDTPPVVISLLTDFVLYDAVRAALGVASFLEVNAILWHARAMPARRSSTPAAGTMAAVREARGEYAAPPSAPPEEATERDLLRLVEGRIAAQGFIFPELAVRDYYIALKTKPFVILAGLSGTGKTRLTELFAEALTENLPAQYRLLPVRPDWTDSTALLGYHNLITDDYVSTPFLDLLVEAARPENAQRAYFVCLDEMNLARVEHYFADLLSAMETRTRTIPLHAARTVRIPANLFLTGSVNVDEATHPFSKKVLDRANTLEFTEVRIGRLSDAAAGGHRVALPEIAPHERQRLFLHSRVRDVRDAQERLAALNAAYPGQALGVLSSLNDLLATRGAHFGYRVRDEALMYVANAFDAQGQGLLLDSRSPDANLAVALDLQIVQKALPRLSGTQEALEKLLVELEAWAGDRYPRTGEKLSRMRRRAGEEGIVTFYEP